MKKGILFALLIIAAVLSFASNPSAQAKIGDNKIYPVVVDYSKSLDEMIQSGNYVEVDRDITTENFPVEDYYKARINLQLIYFGRDTTPEEVIQEMDRRSLRPATLPEMLAFGAKYPEMGVEFPVMAFGSISTKQDDVFNVPYLGQDVMTTGLRELGLFWYDLGWGWTFHYLAAPKQFRSF